MMKPAIVFVGCVLATSPLQAKELTSVGISVGSLGNPYYVALAAGAEHAAKEINPNVKVTALGFERDLNKQVEQIDNYIAAGVDMIVMSAADPKAIEPAVAKAKAAGIKVLAVDNSVDNADVIVTTDNVAAGTIACQYIADKIGGKGNVIIQNGPQNSGVIDRVVGCKEVFGKYPDITILSDNQDGKSSRDGGMDVMLGDLTRFPDIQGVFTCCDPQAIGSDLAARQLKRDGIIITSVDGAPDIVEALKSDTLIEASASQDPYGMAVTAVKMGYDLMNDKPVAEPKMLVTPKLVTRENVDQYKGWGG
nr:ABC transporter substrate-binding protein [Aureimonas frigidaquae]